MFFLTTLLITQPSIIAGKIVEIFLAGFIATMVEAFTKQFDNFICSQI